MGEIYESHLKQYIWFNDKMLDTIFRYPERTLLYNKGSMYNKFTGQGMDIIEDENIDFFLENQDKKLKEFMTADMSSILEFYYFKGWILFKDEPQKSCKIKIKGDREHYFPGHLAIELTDACNLHCKHCYRSADYQGDYINKEKLFVAIEESVKNGLSIVELTGGEVTLHPDFCEILDYMCDKLEIVAVLTNGYFYNKDILECFKRNRKKLLVNISIDSNQANFHDEFRGRTGAWEKSCELIRILSKENILVRVAMSITPGNMFDIEQTLLMVKKMGARAFAWDMASGFGRGSDINWESVSQQMLLRYEKQSNYLYKKYHEMLTLVPAKMCRKMNNEEINCGAGWRTYAVAPDGRIRTCVNAEVDSINLGNFLEYTDSLFQHEKMRELASIPVPTYHRCKTCDTYIYCQGCLIKGFIASKKVEGCSWKGKTFVGFNTDGEIKNGCSKAIMQ